MVTYPIRIHGDPYRGADQKKRAKAREKNRIAAELTQAINAMLLEQTEPTKLYGWPEIARRSGYDVEIVAKFGLSIDAGSGGFIAWRHDMTYQQAMAILDHNQMAVTSR